VGSEGGNLTVIQGEKEKVKLLVLGEGGHRREALKRKKKKHRHKLEGHTREGVSLTLRGRKKILETNRQKSGTHKTKKPKRGKWQWGLQGGI